MSNWFECKITYDKVCEDGMNKIPPIAAKNRNCMTQKQYEKDFKERFGVQPFTAEEICEIKAMLFNMGMHPDCGNQPNRYIRYQINAAYMEEKRMKEQAEDAFYEELASFVNYG